MNELASVEADVLRVGYQVGYFAKAEIARWADRQIVAIDEPSRELCDLSMIQDVDPHDVLKLLAYFGQNNPAHHVETEIGFVGLMGSSNRVTTEQAIHSLFRLVHSPGLTADQRSWIYVLEDGYDLAVNGIHGSLADVEAELHTFVDPYAESLTQTHPQLFARTD